MFLSYPGSLPAPLQEALKQEQPGQRPKQLLDLGGVRKSWNNPGSHHEWCWLTRIGKEVTISKATYEAVVAWEGRSGSAGRGTSFLTVNFELLQTPQAHLNWFSQELCKTLWHHDQHNTASGDKVKPLSFLGE